MRKTKHFHEQLDAALGEYLERLAQLLQTLLAPHDALRNTWQAGGWWEGGLLFLLK